MVTTWQVQGLLCWLFQRRLGVGLGTADAIGAVMAVTLIFLKWGIPKIRGPNIDPQTVRLLLQGLPKRAPQFLETAK